MILHGDSIEQLKTLSNGSVQCCVTSPPYWGLRDYGVDGQLGLEKTPDEYVAKLVEVFREVRRVLKDDGTLWLNLGDSYAGGQSRGKSPMSEKEASNVASAFQNGRKAVIPKGIKPKDLVGIPWRMAFALQADGWYLRQDIIWHKPNPMPESVRDRCTKAHEYIFLLSKSAKYFFDSDAIKEMAVSPEGPRNKKPHSKAYDNAFRQKYLRTCQNVHNIGPRETRNKRSVWSITTKPFKDAHFATMPIDLAETCVLAGSRQGDTVLDPFAGACTTGLAAIKHGREFVGVELNPDYIDLAKARIERFKNQTKGKPT